MANNREEINDSLDERDSGPFCPHFYHPCDCTYNCKCGHECREHSYWSNNCDEEDCSCEHFEDTTPPSHARTVAELSEGPDGDQPNP